MDRISNLPIDLKHNILCKLSIKEAVRTTVLSTSWKHGCDTLPHLVFDERTKSKSKTRFYHIVDQVLSLQENYTSLVTFKLDRQNEHVDTRHIDRWIRHLSRTSVKVVALKQGVGSLYRVSSRLFSFRDLERLELYRCGLRIRPSFEGFGKLRRLDIQKSAIVEGALEKLISCCPLLADLIARKCSGIAHLSIIDAPNLKHLDLDGPFKDINIKNCFNLCYIAINLHKASGSFSNLLEYFVQLPSLKTLQIHGYFLQCAVDSLTEELWKPNLCLESLCLCICLTSVDEILTALSLLRSSPALQDLELSVWKGDGAASAAQETTYWLNDNQSWDKFIQLKKLKVTSFSAGAKNEVDFIMYLLLSSPALRELEIKARKTDPATEKSKSLLDDFQKYKFSELEVVKLSCISGDESEVDLIAFLLHSSPRLRKMTIRPVGSISRSSEREIFRRLLNLSSLVPVIEYLDPMTESESESESDSESDSDSDSD